MVWVSSLCSIYLNLSWIAGNNLVLDDSVSVRIRSDLSTVCMLFLRTVWCPLISSKMFFPTYKIVLLCKILNASARQKHITDHSETGDRIGQYIPVDRRPCNLSQNSRTTQSVHESGIYRHVLENPFCADKYKFNFSLFYIGPGPLHI